MAYVYARGNVWWYRVKENGKWESYATELHVNRGPDGKPDPTAKKNAKRLAKRAQERVDARGPGAPAGPLTVRQYAKPWIERRREADLDWKNDRSRLEHHVLGVIGDMPIADVRAKHLADLVHGWRFTTKLAPRSVYNVFSTVRALLRDAAVDGVIDHNPAREIGEPQLGPLVDKDRRWRAEAVFTRAEAETMISDERIPFDRRLYYACELLAGMRPGEIAALRWSDYDATVEPLGRLTVAEALNTRKNTIKGTKTNAVRRVPVHPTLAAMLAEWKLSGWSEMMGRAPEPGDLVLPLPPAAAAARRTRTGEPIRTGDYAGKKWRDVDLKMLGWRGRRMYDGKSTFITLAIEDGADPEIIRQRVTHARARRNAFDGYDRGEHWARTCAEVAKLKITRVTVRVTVLSIVRDR